MDFIKFPINQSLIHALLYNGEERELCPKNIHLTKITRQLRDADTQPMLYGRYFETQCLGKSAGEPVHDLPRKNLTKHQQNENAVRKAEKRPLLKGDKYLDHIRIDDQVERFKAKVKEHQMVVFPDNVQVPIRVIWEDDPEVMLTAELDIFPTPILLDGELYAAIIDLKLTADINSTFGEYSYGAPEHLDLIQGKMYHYLVRNIDRELNPNLDSVMTDTVKKLINQDRIMFLLWVFNYKKNKLEDKFIRIKWDVNKRAELFESIRKSIALLNSMEKQDWPTHPEYHLCKHCPWKECPDRIKIQSV